MKHLEATTQLPGCVVIVLAAFTVILAAFTVIEIECIVLLFKLILQ